METVIGTVVGLARFPVKSLVGEACERLELEPRGVVGDRLWAVRHEDGKLGSGKSTRRFRRTDGLLDYAAAYEGELPVITFPDGRRLRADDPGIHAQLSFALNVPVTLAPEQDVSHFDAGPVSLVTTASLAAIGAEVRRFRMNLVLEGFEPWAEERWLGRELALGDTAVLRVTKRIERCVMITLPQRDLPPARTLLKELTETRGGCFGVYAEVVAPGPVAVGARCRLR